MPNLAATAVLDRAFAAEPADVADLTPPETLPSLRPPGRRQDAADLAKLLTSAKAMAAKVEVAVSAAAAELEGIDKRFRPEARAEAAGEIRTRTHDTAWPLLGQILDAAGEAESQRPFHLLEVRRRAARFAPEPDREAAERTSAVLRAQTADLAGLQALALLAAGRGDVALAVVVADELARRDGVGDGDRRAILRLLPAPAPAPELETIDAVKATAQAAEWRLREFARPGSTRVDKVTAGLSAA